MVTDALVGLQRATVSRNADPHPHSGQAPLGRRGPQGAYFQFPEKKFPDTRLKIPCSVA